MVAAYLRGVLKPTQKYGLRSSLAENLLLEAVAAEVSAGALDVSACIDATICSVIKPEARQEHLRSVFARAGRATELRLHDIHRLGRIDLVKSGDKDSLSVFQLYQLLQKKGILDAMRSHYTQLASP